MRQGHMHCFEDTFDGLSDMLTPVHGTSAGLMLGLWGVWLACAQEVPWDVVPVHSFLTRSQVERMNYMDDHYANDVAP
jgi:hypothetical protein